MAVIAEDRSEIAFFDVETTVPTRPGQGFAILEFGAILVCPRKLVELRSYSTLLRPADLSHISSLSVRCNGITRDAVISAPTFADIADVVYGFLHGRIWAGHNILRFDCARIREAFAEINRPPPEPKGTIDSLALLTQKFGRRAGDMKMASLATYFGLGQQTHRSLDDVRMNLEVLKYCATVLFLESSLPDVLIENSWISPNAMTRSRSNGKSHINQTLQNGNMASSSVKAEDGQKLSPPHHIMEENHPIFTFTSPQIGEVKLPLSGPNSAIANPFDLSGLVEGMGEPLPEDSMEEEKDGPTSTESQTSVCPEHFNGCDVFQEPDNISIPSMSVTLAPVFRGLHKVQISYLNFPLQLRCASIRVRFGISTKFVDHAGRPRLSFVVDAPPSLCKVLDEIDDLAQKTSIGFGSSSEWRSVVSRKPGFVNYPTVRLHLPTVVDGETTRWATEMYQKDGLVVQKLVFSRFDVTELDSLFTPGNFIDAYFSLDAYDYQQNAGIRLVAKKVIFTPQN